MEYEINYDLIGQIASFLLFLLTVLHFLLRRKNMQVSVKVNSLAGNQLQIGQLARIVDLTNKTLDGQIVLMTNLGVICLSDTQFTWEKGKFNCNIQLLLTTEEVKLRNDA